MRSDMSPNGGERMSSAAKNSAVKTLMTSGPTSGPPWAGRSARKKMRSAPVSPVARRRTNVAIVTAQMDRSTGQTGYPAADVAILTAE